jgi:hypothetical protein
MLSRSLMLTSLVVLSCSTTGQRPPPDARPTSVAAPLSTRLLPPADLPGPVRQVLQSLMAQHRSDMTDLVAASMGVLYEDMARAADRVAATSISRPLTGDATELNAFLPARFFDLQDELVLRARNLAGAARQHDRATTASAYAAISETCLNCHAIYRDARRQPAATGAR